MTIEYAILGLLSWKPLSGYDLKKIIAESDIYYWSGNNNQIYRSLLQLYQEELVSQNVVLQETLPARKEYSITEKGLMVLHDWLLTTPDLPELHNTFLIRLSWANSLSDHELKILLQGYGEEVRARWFLQKEQNRRTPRPDRTPREQFLWQKIAEKELDFYQSELVWLEELQNGLFNQGVSK